MIPGTISGAEGSSMTFQAEGDWFGHSTREGYFHFDSQAAYECPRCLTVLVPGPDTTVVSVADETRWRTPQPPAPPERTIKPDPPAGDPPPTWQVYDGKEDSP